MCTLLYMPMMPRHTEWQKEVGERLAATRSALGLSQEALATICGVTRSTVGNYEQGTRLPDVAAMARFSRRYKVPLDWIYLGEPSGLPFELAKKLFSFDSPLTLPPRAAS